VNRIALVAVAVVALAMSIGMRHFATQAAAGADRWRTRLESRRPEPPMAYFELAGELAVAAAASDEADRDLARRLFALAGALDPK
jgi:hypothetical protein